jgi:hypothetical protein
VHSGPPFLGETKRPGPRNEGSDSKCCFRPGYTPERRVSAAYAGCICGSRACALLLGVACCLLLLLACCAASAAAGRAFISPPGGSESDRKVLPS